MDGAQLTYTLVSAILGGGTAGLTAYVGVIKSISRLETKIVDIEKSSERIKKKVNEIDGDAQEHREKGPHITEDYKRMLEERFDFIKGELQQIRQTIRI